MLLAMAVMVSLAYAPIPCFPTINDLSVTTAHFGESNQCHSSQWVAIVAFGVVTWWIINHEGVDSTQYVFVVAQSEGKCTVVYP